MDWNGWHSIAQARGDGLRPELLDGIERLEARAASVIELEDYRLAQEQFDYVDPTDRQPCTIIPFPVLAKRRVVPERWPRKEGLKPRQSRARNLSRPAREPANQQPE
ncbi:MAG: hypothetical protein QM744_11460 [Mesorhizobium sp.]